MGSDEMQLALYDDIVVEAVNEEKDKSKKYVCPECGEEVILRKGEINIPHFAHIKDTVCDGCDMTLTHKYAEQILCNGIGKIVHLKPINIPIKCLEVTRDVVEEIYTINGEARRLNYKGNLPDVNKEITAFDCAELHIDKTVLEPRYNDIVPDVELISNLGTKLFVEVYVRHKVDSNKLHKLMKLGIPTIEIDLSSIHNKFMKKEIVNLQDELQKILFTVDLYEYTRWLVLPKLDEENFYMYARNYVQPYFDKYKRFRDAYMFYLFGPGDGHLEELTVTKIGEVNSYLNTILSYQYFRCSNIKNDIKNVRIKAGSKGSIEDNLYYKLWFERYIVDCGYNIVNDSIISTVTGEKSSYNDHNIYRFEKLFNERNNKQKSEVSGFSSKYDLINHLKDLKNNNKLWGYSNDI